MGVLSNKYQKLVCKIVTRTMLLCFPSSHIAKIHFITKQYYHKIAKIIPTCLKILFNPLAATHNGMECAGHIGQK